jgi:hypothetical protein
LFTHKQLRLIEFLEEQRDRFISNGAEVDKLDTVIDSLKMNYVVFALCVAETSELKGLSKKIREAFPESNKKL